MTNTRLIANENIPSLVIVRLREIGPVAMSERQGTHTATNVDITLSRDEQGETGSPREAERAGTDAAMGADHAS